MTDEFVFSRSAWNLLRLAETFGTMRILAQCAMER
jgi:hypothetical protein